MNKETNQPAFPNPRWEGWGEPEQGMTLRDYFAAKAMQGGIGLVPQMVPPKNGKTVPQIISEFAYEYADAMMEARK